MKQKISILGIGSGGQNIVDYLYQNNQHNNLNFTVINSDEQVLELAKTPNKYLLTDKLYPKFIYKIFKFFNKKPSLGCGGNVEKGKALALLHKNKFQKLISKSDIVVLISTFGGGCGTGATPVFAETIKQANIKTIAIVITPFNWDKLERKRIASDGIETLKPFVNKLIVLDNQALINELPLDISLKEAWNDINKKIADKFYDEQSKLA